MFSTEHKSLLIYLSYHIRTRTLSIERQLLRKATGLID